MSRLQSIAVQIRPAALAVIKGHMGRAVQQFALSSIFEPYSSQLSAQLHDENKVKPYTTSGLFRPETTQPLRSGQHQNTSTWFRITGIGDEINDALDQWCKKAPAKIEIDNQLWWVDRLIPPAETTPWTAQTTIQSLIQAHRDALPQRTIKLIFASPTAFRSESLPVPFPLPKLLFRSLADRWNAFIPQEHRLGEEIFTFAEQFIEITDFSGETEKVMLKGEVFTGFVGGVKYHVNASNAGFVKRFPEEARKFTKIHVDLSRAVAMLTDFAFFCGVGIKPTAGMGMTQKNHKTIGQEDALA